MTTMRRGTTPLVTVSVDADLTDAQAVLTIETGCTKLNLTPVSIDVDDGESVLTFTPTQEETLALHATSTAKVQLRWLVGASAFASDIVTVSVGDVLEEAVMVP